MEIVVIIFLSIASFFAFLSISYFPVFLLKNYYRKKQIEKLSLEKAIAFRDFLFNLKKTLFHFSKNKIGALIILTRSKEDISNLIYRDGIYLDAVPSFALLQNIFTNKKTEIHDGGVLIDGNYRIINASVLIALETKNKTTSKNISGKNFGARHNAAMFLSERSNAWVLVISETTGKISFFRKRTIFHANNKSKINQIIKEIENYWNEN